MQIPTSQLSLDDIPAEDASNQNIFRFVRTLNGYKEVGGNTQTFTTYLKELK